MDKQFYTQCIKQEVEYSNRSKKDFLYKLYCRYLKPETNAVYLVRTQQFTHYLGGINRLRSKYCEIVLMQRYEIFVHKDADIGIGLKIVHPTSISIGNAVIGRDFIIYQNCTFGNKRLCNPVREDFPRIGDNATMFANSLVIGNVLVADDMPTGVNSVLFHNAKESEIYGGSSIKKK